MKMELVLREILDTFQTFSRIFQKSRILTDIWHTVRNCCTFAINEKEKEKEKENEKGEKCYITVYRVATTLKS